MAKNRVQVVLEDETLAALDKWSQEFGLNRSQVIDHLVKCESEDFTATMARMLAKRVFKYLPKDEQKALKRLGQES